MGWDCIFYVYEKQLHIEKIVFEYGHAELFSNDKSDLPLNL